MIKNTRQLFLLLICINSINSVSSQSIEKQSVLAVLTLNIARFTNWPDHVFSQNNKSQLNLCVFGNNIVQQSFKNINQKKVNKKTIQIITLSRLRNLKQCQLLFLSELEQSRLTLLLKEIENQPILTIGENMSFLHVGGMIGLEKINGKIQLNVNLPIIKKSQLIISSRLLNLANIVDFPILEN